MNSHILELATALRHELHAMPELSGHEIRTKRRLQEFLRAHSSLEITDRGAWFFAFRKGGDAKAPIAFRAEMDAIAMDETIALPYASATPGVSHKCGHDGHCAALAALALETEQLPADRDIYFIFQHAEETGQGGQECAALLKEKGIAEVFAFHNMAGLERGTVAIRSGTMNCASQGLILRFTGVPAHASLPETGKTPALAVADLIRVIADLTAPGTYPAPVWCTVIQVALGSENFGIAAGEGSVLLTCRGEREADMQRLSDRIIAAAQDFARRDGLALELAFRDVFPETVNHPEAADAIRAACKKLGYPRYEMPEPMRASEDVGHFFKAAKGALFLLHSGDRPAIHTPEYDFDDSIIERAVELFKALI
ncbi:amidohydrolase [Desulfovibrio sp. OttesenSCG-928-I05]|nr:amidohydrolase [Desulfovibrio sp. OttesenSCG-928-I05]